MLAPLPRPRWQRARGGAAPLLVRSVQCPTPQRGCSALCGSSGLGTGAGSEGRQRRRLRLRGGDGHAPLSYFGRFSCGGARSAPRFARLRQPAHPFLFISSLLAAAAHQGGGTRRRTAFPWDSFVLKTRAHLAFVNGVFRSGSLSYTGNPPARRDKIQRDFRTDPVLKWKSGARGNTRAPSLFVLALREQRRGAAFATGGFCVSTSRTCRAGLCSVAIALPGLGPWGENRSLFGGRGRFVLSEHCSADGGAGWDPGLRVEAWHSRRSQWCTPKAAGLP